MSLKYEPSSEPLHMYFADKKLLSAGTLLGQDNRTGDYRGTSLIRNTLRRDPAGAGQECQPPPRPLLRAGPPPSLRVVHLGRSTCHLSRHKWPGGLVI